MRAIVLMFCAAVVCAADPFGSVAAQQAQEDLRIAKVKYIESMVAAWDAAGLKEVEVADMPKDPRDSDRALHTAALRYNQQVGFMNGNFHRFLKPEIQSENNATQQMDTDIQATRRIISEAEKAGVIVVQAPPAEIKPKPKGKISARLPNGTVIEQ